MVVDADEEQRRNEQWRQGKQEMAEAQNRVEEDKEQRVTTETESGKIEHREQQEKGPGGKEQEEGKTCERKEGINGRLFVGGKQRP